MQMDFWLDDDSSYLKCRMRIVNESTEVIPMYWWSNMAVPEYEQGHITVPASEAYAGTGVECRKVIFAGSGWCGCFGLSENSTEY